MVNDDLPDFAALSNSATNKKHFICTLNISTCKFDMYIVTPMKFFVRLLKFFKGCENCSEI